MVSQAITLPAAFGWYVSRQALQKLKMLLASNTREQHHKSLHACLSKYKPRHIKEAKEIRANHMGQAFHVVAGILKLQFRISKL